MDLIKFILLKKLRKQYNDYYNSDIELISDHKIQRIEAVKIINRIKYQEKLIFDELEKDE